MALRFSVRRSQTVLHGYQTDSIFNLFRLGQWVHLATVYEAEQSNVRLYANGELTKREPIAKPASGLLKIGNATIANWSVRNFNGCLDELIVFGQPLGDHEIRRIYEVERP